MATKQFIQTLAFLVMLAGFVFFVFGIVHTVANEMDGIGRKGGVCLIIYYRRIGFLCWSCRMLRE